MVGALLTCASGFLCVMRRKFIDIFFRDCFTVLKETERKWKILEEEMKYHGTVDESSLEQQFRNLDTITFLCENLKPYA